MVSRAVGGAELGTPKSLRTLDPSRRAEVMEYLFEQLRAYQDQLKELELHHAWKQRTTAQHTQQQHSNAGGHGSGRFSSLSTLLPPIPQGGTTNMSWPVQSPSLVPSEHELAGVYGNCAGTIKPTLLAVDAPIRLWGKRDGKGGVFGHRATAPRRHRQQG